MRCVAQTARMTLLVMATVFSLAVSGLAQQPQIASVVHSQHAIKSQVLGEDRTILVRVPRNYDNIDLKFPVVYMLDAHPPQNAMMAGLLEQQAWGAVMPEMILVGIQNTNRLRDLTPTATERSGSGGGQKFLQFIETEVIPLVEKEYRTQPYRIFAGHSLGGLFVFYSFVERPDLFNAYIAASPVLNWDKEYVIKRAERLLKEGRSWKKRLFVALGDEPEYLGGFNSLQSLLKRTQPKGIEYEFRQFKDENHGSVVLPAYYAGLRRIYEGWVMREAAALNEVEGHYRKLSDRYGYSIPPPENLINQIGFLLLRSEKLEEALEAFKKNTEYYPNSANVYDSLGEAYEKAGRLKAALDSYEKAFQLAEDRNDTARARIFKANFERVSAKLKYA